MTVTTGPGANRDSGHFGPYGGQFAPEALMSALEDLAAEYASPRLTRPSRPNSPTCSAATRGAPPW